MEPVLVRIGKEFSYSYEVYLVEKDPEENRFREDQAYYTRRSSLGKPDGVLLGTVHKKHKRVRSGSLHSLTSKLIWFIDDDDSHHFPTRREAVGWLCQEKAVG